MPELPEVETIARKLRPALTGRSFVQVDVLWARTVDRPDVARFRTALLGASVQEVGRRGKYLVLPLNTGQTLLVHLRMTGKFSLLAPSAGPGDDRHMRVRMRLDDGVWVVYSDPRKFGRFFLVTDPAEVLKGLGPEPLSPEFTAEWLMRQLAGRQGEIKRLLLDQKFIAGLGNIYVSEALWQAQIHPLRVAGTLTTAEVERLHRAIGTVLGGGIANGGTSLGDRQYVYPDGGLGNHQHYLQIYDRAGDRCPRCGYALERIVQGQRSTYFCPICQRAEP
ncbi:MAG TPA: bifunctional DNA-formamidopyrimidine glycosylase/DNA-(apurinic or apyrimidinic site) lyase [Anaerolineae bacterium]|nr:bifunctional DNA-formamidopyrimidine glycosylase/DNA-(apurinic or apyrimidinic site) lyase [Anaerolineae bacterium]